MPPSRTYPPEAGAGPHPSPRMRRRPSTHSRGMVTIRRPVRTVAGKGGIRVTKQIDVLTTVEVADPAARRVRRTPSTPPPRRSDRVARGLATRREIPLESHAVLDTSPLRADPVELLERQAASRVPELVPIRYGRMLVSPFTFAWGCPGDDSWPCRDSHDGTGRAGLRRRAPVQLRSIRLAGAAPGLRHQRLRRDADRP